MLQTFTNFATKKRRNMKKSTIWTIAVVMGLSFLVLLYVQLSYIEAMAKMNEEKAKILYDFLDQSKLFKGTVEKEFRSLMNVPFVTPTAEQDADVVAATKAAGFDNLKGHKSVGGLRASIYNAMPKEGVVALVDFLKKYEAEHMA